jgi:alanine racemase
MLKAVVRLPHPPKFHLKIDTGMHRQGFYLDDVPKVVKSMANAKARIGKRLQGVLTHFASAKDLNYPTYTDAQYEQFEKACALLRKAGYPRLVRHASATGGTLIGKKYHADAVRVGIGLYGLWPSKELEAQLSGRIHLRPVLSWRTVITEVKKLSSGDLVGYDLTERVHRPTIAAILPIGYWHGFPRSLSSIGEVLVRGTRAKVLGRVSMDMIVVDATEARPRVGDMVTVLGRDGREELLAADVALQSGTSHYEFVTRLNPLMERIVV